LEMSNGSMHDGRSAISGRNRGAVGGVTTMLDRCRDAVTAPPHDGTVPPGACHTAAGTAQSSSELPLPQCGIKPAHSGCARLKSHHGGQRQDANSYSLRTKLSYLRSYTCPASRLNSAPA